LSGSAQPRPKGQVPPRGGSKKGRTQSRPAPSDASASGGSATKSTSASQPRGRQAAAQARRKRNRWLAIGSVAVVVVVVAVFVVVKVAGGGSSGPPREPIPADQMAHLTSVPISTLVEGTADKNLSLTPPQAGAGGARLTAAGKPEMLFIGAEFCPICATERWVMLVALSHFGTFANVSKTHSAVRDGNIATVSFYNSTFTSPYLTFTPVETTTNQPQGNYYKTLQTPTPEQVALWKANEQGGQEAFPFIDIGGKWVLVSSQFSDTLLQGKSFDTIVNSIGSNENTIGVNVSASAAVMTKAICDVTNQQPAATCKAVAGVPMGTSSSSSSSSGQSTPAG
jgi:hypothetical protein